MTKANIIFKFTQRALWLYITEATIVLVIGYANWRLQVG